MSTAAVSGSSIYQELQTFYQTRQSDLSQLGSALQSGDLNGAQQAFQALAQLGESGPFANSEPFGKSGRANDFNAIGEALQGGNLAQAQAAFAALTGNQSNTQAAAPGIVVNLTTTQPATTTATGDTTSIYQQLQAYRQQRLADLNQLGQDLQAGNLTAAQQDFSTLTALGQSGPNANGQLFQRADRAQDFQAIGQALQSGDLAGAQSAFASLASTFGSHNQNVISAYSSGTTATVPPIQLLPPSTVNLPPSTINLVPPSTINLLPPSTVGPPPSTVTLPPVSSVPPSIVSPPPVTSTPPTTITLSTGSTNPPGIVITSPADQLTINLNQQNNYEVILNLLNSNAAGQTQNGSGSGLNVQI